MSDQGDEELCIFCKQRLEGDGISKLTQKGLNKIRECSERRGDGLLPEINEDLTAHVKCRKVYTNENIVKAYRKRKLLSDAAKLLSPTFNFELNCLFCGNEALENKTSNLTNVVGGVIRIKKPHTKESMKDIALRRKDSLGEMVFRRIQDVDLVAVAARYHYSCYQTFRLSSVILPPEGQLRCPGRPLSSTTSSDTEDIYRHIQNPSRRVNYSQLLKLWEYLNNHREVAFGCNQTSESKEYHMRLWEKASQILNSVGKGSIKSGPEWSKYWAEYKSDIIKDHRLTQNARNTTGDSSTPVALDKLEEIELRFLKLLEEEYGSDKHGVQVDLLPRRKHVESVSSTPVASSSRRSRASEQTAEPEYVDIELDNKHVEAVCSTPVASSSRQHPRTSKGTEKPEYVDIVMDNGQGSATVSSSMAARTQMRAQAQVPPENIAAPFTAAYGSGTPQPRAPAVNTEIPSYNGKERCRNFLSNLLELSRKELKSVQLNVRNLIQELINAQLEPEEFIDELGRLLNASPRPGLNGFLKTNLPPLRQSLVTKELVIEGINPPDPSVAFSKTPVLSQSIITTPKVQMECKENVLTVDFEEESDNEESQNEDTCLRPEPPEPPRSGNRVAQAQNARNRSEKNTPRVSRPENPSERTTVEEDEYDLFGRSMAMQLRKLPELDALELMHKMQFMVVSKKKQLQQSREAQPSRKRTICSQGTGNNKRSAPASSSPVYTLSVSSSPSENLLFASTSHPQNTITNSCLEDPLMSGQCQDAEVKQEDLSD